MIKIGDILIRPLVSLAIAAAVTTAAFADEPSFSAQVDHSEIGLDESVSLKLSVTVDGSTNLGTPTFAAPGFEVVNEYTSTFVKSYYENGHFGSQNEVQITKVLKPTKMGVLKISQIKVNAGGKVMTAPDIAVTVTQAGAGTPPPNAYGGGGVGLRGASRITSNAKPVVIRAEVDKSKAYKGEQVVVSYYLLSRVRMFNLSVERFPNLNGFLKEELEMPVMAQGGSLHVQERVVINGVAYDKSLLARYAVYPLEEGNLRIDPMEMKYNYYGESHSARDDDDPFQNFFNQMTPLSAQSESDALSVNVVPLPDAGKPPSFSGGVGDFSVTSAVDKYEVRANEAVNLKVVVEGRGNIAAIGEPKGAWPANVELYDSKGSAKTGKGGVGEKTFEFLLIPRAPGKVTLPALDFSFFDPAKQAYVTRSTRPIDLTVTDPAPGSALVPPKTTSPTGASAPSGNGSGETLADLKPFVAGANSGALVRGLPIWRWVYWLCAAAFAFFVFIVARDKLKSLSARSQESAQGKARVWSKNFAKLKLRCIAAAQSGEWSEVLLCYEGLSSAVFESLDRKFGIGARALPRSRLKELLVEDRRMSPDLWSRISAVLEYGEMVRFATTAGAVSEQEARDSLLKWFNETGQVIENLI